jgi:hypothetical protein
MQVSEISYMQLVALIAVEKDGGGHDESQDILSMIERGGSELFLFIIKSLDQGTASLVQ